MNRVAIRFAEGAMTLYGYHLASSWAEAHFPPHPIPPLPPMEGHLVYGYMGCPKSKVREVQKCDRHLFFAADPITPQIYALSRTNILDWILGRDEPVVLQIEIPEGKSIKDMELWRDPRLSLSCAPPSDTFVSYHPAIPSDIQKKNDVKFRVHHIVGSKNRVEGGGIYRCIEYILNTVRH
ncbi:MAG: hypothetical protein K9M07_02540 [Simkaniaceae bacterium]|nr:hypothetical protein [Simkaniaceae bacterium]